MQNARYLRDATLAPLSRELILCARTIERFQKLVSFPPDPVARDPDAHGASLRMRRCGIRDQLRVRYAPIAALCGSTLQPEAPMHRTSFAIAHRLPRTLDVLRARDAAGVMLLATL